MPKWAEDLQDKPLSVIIDDKGKKAMKNLQDKQTIEI